MADSYLFVQQYSRLRRIRPLPYRKESLEHLLQHWLVNSGVRQVDPVHGLQHKRKEAPMLHGFRKFFTTQLVHSKVIPEIMEMLLGHKIGAYYKPTEDEMLEEYMKAIDNLTINEENRLRKKVEKLEVEASQLQRLQAAVQRLEEKMSTK